MNQLYFNFFLWWRPLKTTNKHKKSLLCVSPGDSGEGAWNHSFGKQWSGLWPAIWTCCLSCRVRREEDMISASLSQHLTYDLSTQHALTASLSYLSYADAQCANFCVCVFVISAQSQRNTAGFLIKEASLYPILWESPLTLSVIHWCKECCVRLLILLKQCDTGCDKLPDAKCKKKVRAAGWRI